MQHPDHTVVVYANTSAAVKARADWVVTSSIALEKLLNTLIARGEKIIWGPDRHLGSSYIAKENGARICSCGKGNVLSTMSSLLKRLRDMKHLHPDAAVLVHPESLQPAL